jgi:hypothetical protein
MAGLGMSAVGLGAAVEMFDELKGGYSSDEKWIVVVGAEYGVYVELGTSNMAAQPYLFPAAKEVMRTDFQQIEGQASSVSDMVRLLALEIEAKATRKAPVDTGNLQNSIEAFPAGGQP